MDNDLRHLTAAIVSAYAANNNVATNDLSRLIQNVFLALDRLGKEPAAPARVEPQRPAVPIRRSITPEHIICLECGNAQKTLKRHLRSEHDLTPDEYRTKWHLPHEYPMTAPKYAEVRSQMAKAIGLGRRSGPTRKKRR